MTCSHQIENELDKLTADRAYVDDKKDDEIEAGGERLVQ